MYPEFNNQLQLLEYSDKVKTAVNNHPIKTNVNITLSYTAMAKEAVVRINHGCALRDIRSIEELCLKTMVAKDRLETIFFVNNRVPENLDIGTIKLSPKDWDSCMQFMPGQTPVHDWVDWSLENALSFSQDKRDQIRIDNISPDDVVGLVLTISTSFLDIALDRFLAQQR